MSRHGDDEGAVAILVAIFAVVIFGFASIVVDLGYARTLKVDRQDAADAAALAAARALPDVTMAVKAAGLSASQNIDIDADPATWTCLDVEPSAGWHRSFETACITFSEDDMQVSVALPDKSAPSFISGALGLGPPTIRVNSFATRYDGVHLSAGASPQPSPSPSPTLTLTPTPSLTPTAAVTATPTPTTPDGNT